MLSGIIVVVGISLLILIHEAGHFWAAKKAGLKVEEFGFGFPPRMFGIKKGETTFSFNWLPFGGFVKIYGEHKAQVEEQATQTGEQIDTRRSFAHQSAWRRVTVIAAGVAMNFLLGWLLLSLVFMVGAPQTVVITDVAPDSPAALAGVIAGDQVIEYQTTESFIADINAHKGKPFTFSLKRGSERLSFTTTPRVSPKPTEGALGVVISEAGFPRLPFFAALWQGLVSSIEVMGQIFITFGQLIGSFFISGGVSEGVVGPVGIFGVAHKLGALGFIYLMQLIAMISLNLAVLNVIPFPALDGGRLLFIVIEKIKGSPIAPKKELVFNITGFVLLLVLMAVITTRDIIRLF